MENETILFYFKWIEMKGNKHKPHGYRFKK